MSLDITKGLMAVSNDKIGKMIGAENNRLVLAVILAGFDILPLALVIQVEYGYSLLRFSGCRGIGYGDGNRFTESPDGLAAVIDFQADDRSSLGFIGFFDGQGNVSCSALYMLTSQTLPTQCHLTYKKSMALGYKLLAL